MRYVLILVGVLLHHVLSAQAAPQPWELKSEKDGVKVYFRKTSDIYGVKLTSSFKTTLSSLTYLLVDVDQFEAWGYKVSQVRLLKQISPTDFYYYAKLDFPWPLADRDVVMHSTVVQDSATRRVKVLSESVPDMIPPVADIIRIREAHTKWSLYPSNNGWIYGEYEIYSNPGGNLPDWLVNMAIDVGPKETMGNIKKFLKEDRYQDVKVVRVKN